MKILYFHNYPFTSEKANLIQVKAMCRAFVNTGCRGVRLILPGKEKRLIHESDFEIKVRRRIISFRFDRFLSPLSLRREIRCYQPDIVFLRDPVYLVYVCLFTESKIIFESHDARLHKGSRLLNRILYHSLISFSRKERFLRFVCISEALKNFWRESGISNEKLITAHDGVDLDRFGKTIDRNTARYSLGLTVNGFVASYVGRIYPNRKLESLLSIAKRLPNILFLVVGGPDNEAANLNSLAEKASISNFKAIGQVKHNEVPMYLAASDILLALWSDEVPTIRYCSPLKLFEYMASRRLIVAHNFNTIEEVLEDDVDAILFPYGNEDLFVDALERALWNLNHSNIPSLAYSKVSRLYTWNLRAEKILKGL